MRVVFDTNTVISGLFWKGAPRQLLDLARNGFLSLFTSPDLLAELTDVLGREKFSERLALVQITAKVLACAKTAKADFIVSGDHHLLRLKEFEGIKIVPVEILLEQFK